MSDLTSKMEQFSLAYVRAVIAAAGLVASQPSADVDSIDLSIQTRREADFPFRPRLDLQVQSTAQAAGLSNGALSYALKLKNYNELREETVVPRILVVVYLPKAIEGWSSHDEQALVLRRCGYWVSLEGLPDTENETSVTVNIPVDNLFGPTQLRNVLTAHQEVWRREG